MAKILGEQRMYVIAMRHLSGIQKGIQGAHAIVEYSNKYSENLDYKQWSQIDKTIILLEINTSKDLKDLFYRIKGLDHPTASFVEPDLDNGWTAIAFLLDEKIWNECDYPFTESLQDETLRNLVKPLRLANN